MTWRLGTTYRDCCFFIGENFHLRYFADHDRFLRMIQEFIPPPHLIRPNEAFVSGNGNALDIKSVLLAVNGLHFDLRLWSDWQPKNIPVFIDDGNAPDRISGISPLERIGKMLLLGFIGKPIGV